MPSRSSPQFSYESKQHNVIRRVLSVHAVVTLRDLRHIILDVVSSTTLRMHLCGTLTLDRLPQVDRGNLRQLGVHWRHAIAGQRHLGRLWALAACMAAVKRCRNYDDRTEASFLCSSAHCNHNGEQNNNTKGTCTARSGNDWCSRQT